MMTRLQDNHATLSELFLDRIAPNGKALFIFNTEGFLEINPDADASNELEPREYSAALADLKSVNSDLKVLKKEEERLAAVIIKKKISRSSKAVLEFGVTMGHTRQTKSSWSTQEIDSRLSEVKTHLQDMEEALTELTDSNIGDREKAELKRGLEDTIKKLQKQIRFIASKKAKHFRKKAAALKSDLESKVWKRDKAGRFKNVITSVSTYRSEMETIIEDAIPTVNGQPLFILVASGEYAVNTDVDTADVPSDVAAQLKDINSEMKPLFSTLTELENNWQSAELDRLKDSGSTAMSKIKASKGSDPKGLSSAIKKGEGAIEELNDGVSSVVEYFTSFTTQDAEGKVIYPFELSVDGMIQERTDVDLRTLDRKFSAMMVKANTKIGTLKKQINSLRGEVVRRRLEHASATMTDNPIEDVDAARTMADQITDPDMKTKVEAQIESSMKAIRANHASHLEGQFKTVTAGLRDAQNKLRSDRSSPKEVALARQAVETFTEQLEELRSQFTTGLLNDNTYTFNASSGEFEEVSPDGGDTTVLGRMNTANGSALKQLHSLRGEISKATAKQLRDDIKAAKSRFVATSSKGKLDFKEGQEQMRFLSDINERLHTTLSEGSPTVLGEPIFLFDPSTGDISINPAFNGPGDITIENSGGVYTITDSRSPGGMSSTLLQTLQTQIQQYAGDAVKMLSDVSGLGKKVATLSEKAVKEEVKGIKSEVRSATTSAKFGVYKERVDTLKSWLEELTIADNDPATKAQKEALENELGELESALLEKELKILGDSVKREIEKSGNHSKLSKQLDSLRASRENLSSYLERLSDYASENGLELNPSTTGIGYEVAGSSGTTPGTAAELYLTDQIRLVNKLSNKLVTRANSALRQKVKSMQATVVSESMSKATMERFREDVGTIKSEIQAMTSDLPGAKTVFESANGVQTDLEKFNKKLQKRLLDDHKKGLEKLKASGSAVKLNNAFEDFQTSWESDFNVDVFEFNDHAAYEGKLESDRNAMVEKKARELQQALQARVSQLSLTEQSASKDLAEAARLRDEFGSLSELGVNSTKVTRFVTAQEQALERKIGRLHTSVETKYLAMKDKRLSGVSDEDAPPAPSRSERRLGAILVQVSQYDSSYIAPESAVPVTKKKGSGVPSRLNPSSSVLLA
jgi:ribosomal protein L31E